MFNFERAFQTMLASIVVCIFLFLFGLLVTLVYQILGLYILIPLLVLVSAFVIGGIS
jgi:hypothetical protein